MVNRSRLISGLKLGFAAGLAFGLASAIPGGAAQSQTVSVGALPQGSLSYAVAAAVAKVIGDKTNLTMRAIGVGGTNIYIPQVNQNKLQMSTAAAPDAIFAQAGTGPHAGHASPNIRVLARMLELQVGFMVKKDSKITALSGFKGQKFPSGFTAQKLVGTLVTAAFATEGMSFSDVKGVPVPNFVRGTDEMVAGRAVGSFLAPGSGVVRKAHAKVGIRFIPMKADPA
ncbi:MAG: TAXI family TRAP transporter solute-binding subunit, partial [Alphaproteobacteria bacterium]